MPFGQSDYHQHEYWQQNEKFQSSGEFSHQLNAANVDVCDHSDDGQ